MYESDVMVAEDVAAFLGLSRNTVYKMASEGTLPSYKVGRKLRFSKRSLQEYLDGLRQAGAAGAAPSLAKKMGGSAFAASPAPSPAASPTAAPSAAVAPASTASATSLAVPGSFATAAQAPAVSLQEIASSLTMGTAAPLTIASDDILAGILAHHLTQHGALAVNSPMSSYAGLVSMYAGLADMALVNLYDFRSNSYNLPYVQRLCPGISTVVIRVLRRRQGFIVAAGNPRSVKSWSALTHEDVCLASRTRGCGARVLQDQKLLGLEADFEEVESRTTECATAAEAVSRVAQGSADLCVGFQEEIGPQRGVQFLPMQTECLDLVVRKTARTKQAIRMAKEILGSQAFRSELERILACDTGVTGAIVYEC